MVKHIKLVLKRLMMLDKNSLWESDYSAAVEATPQASKVPDAPDNVKASSCIARLMYLGKI